MKVEKDKGFLHGWEMQYTVAWFFILLFVIFLFLGSEFVSSGRFSAWFFNTEEREYPSGLNAARLSHERASTLTPLPFEAGRAEK